MTEYRDMTDGELTAELAVWEGHVETAVSSPSAHFAAQQVAAIVAEGNRRDLGFINKYPIRVG